MSAPIVKAYRTKYIVCSILSALAEFAPLVIFAIKGFAIAEAEERVTLGGAFLAAVAFVVVNAIFKYKLRCVIWIVILAVMRVLGDIQPIVVTMLVCTMLDEFALEPLKRHFKAKLTINKEIYRGVA